MSDEELEALWNDVQVRWDDPRAHDAFLEVARSRGALAQAAACYRRVKEGEDEDRRALAEKRLTAVAFLAMQTLESARTPKTEGLPRWVTIVVALVCGVTIAYFLNRMLRG